MKKQSKKYSNSSKSENKRKQTFLNNSKFTRMFEIFNNFLSFFTKEKMKTIYNNLLYAILKKSNSKKLNKWIQKRLQISGKKEKNKFKQAKTNIKFPGDKFNLFKPTILDKYLLKDFLKNAFGALFLFIFIFIITQLINELPYFFKVSHRLPSTGYIIKMYLLRIPYASTLLAPAAFLFSTIFTLGNFYKNNEIVAAVGSGVYLFRLTRPLWVIGLIFSVFLIAFTEYISVPTWDTAQSMNDKIRHPNRYKKDQMNLNITGEGNLFYSMERYDARKKIMIKPIIIKERKNVSEVESQKFKQFSKRIIEVRKRIEEEIKLTKTKKIKSKNVTKLIKRYNTVKNEIMQIKASIRDIKSKISLRAKQIEKLQDLNKILEIKKVIKDLRKKLYRNNRNLRKTNELFEELEKRKKEQDKLLKKVIKKKVIQENEEKLVKKDTPKQKPTTLKSNPGEGKTNVPFYKKYEMLRKKQMMENPDKFPQKKQIKMNFKVSNKYPWPGIIKDYGSNTTKKRPRMGAKVIDPDTLKPYKKEFEILVKNIKKPTIPLYVVYRLDADKIHWNEKTKQWIVQNGVIRFWHEKQGFLREKTKKIKYWILPSKDKPYHFEKNVKKITRMTIPEGVKFIEKLRRSNKKFEHELVDLIGYHFAFQFGTFLIIFIGVTIGKFHSRKNLFIKSLLMALFIFVAYYVTFQFGSSLGKQKLINPYFSPWLGNIAFLAAALIRRRSAQT